MHPNIVPLNRKTETEKTIKQVIKSAVPNTLQKRRRSGENDKSNDSKRKKIAEIPPATKTEDKKEPN